MSTNLYRALLELLPQRPLQVASVVAQDGEYTLVAWPGGAQQRVRGTGYVPGAHVFVRDGLIEGAAPALTSVVIDV